MQEPCQALTAPHATATQRVAPAGIPSLLWVVPWRRQTPREISRTLSQVFPPEPCSRCSQEQRGALQTDRRTQLLRHTRREQNQRELRCNLQFARRAKSFANFQMGIQHTEHIPGCWPPCMSTFHGFQRKMKSTQSTSGSTTCTPGYVTVSHNHRTLCSVSDQASDFHLEFRHILNLYIFH